MDPKSWLWKKRSTASDKANNSLTRKKEEEEEETEEVEQLLTEKAQVQREIRILNDKFSALCECSPKDAIAGKQENIVQEAIAGWEKAETEVISLRKDLDKVLQEKTESEERLSQLDGTLKELMQQLYFVREEQEKRVHGVVVKKSEEFEKIRIVLDEKLAQASKKLVRLDNENAQLNKALLGKDTSIEELSKYKAQIEADMSTLRLRVESTEKENTSLKYEVRLLVKELHIRNEEIEFNRRTADVAQKQHQESIKEIAKLESECRRLRLLVQRRLPGPAAVTKMKSEVQMLGKDQVETRRRKSNASLISSMDFHVDAEADKQKINLIIEHMHAVEEENRNLKYALNKKSNELQFSRTMHPRTALRLPRCYESPNRERRKSPFFVQENLSDLGSDDKASTGAESWACALISELDHFKNEKQIGTPSHAYMGTPDMNLMDDFEEMEKLAVVSVDFPAASSHHSSEEGNERSFGPLGSSPKPRTGGERVTVRINDLLKVLLEHSRELQRDPNQVLEDMKVSLEHNISDTIVFNGKASSNHPQASESPEVVFQTPSDKSMKLHASDTRNDNNIPLLNSTTRNMTQNVSTSVHRILELLEGIKIIPEDNGVAESTQNTNSTTTAGYMVRVFQWRTAQLSGVLGQFVQTCNDFLNGTADVEQFVRLVASSLDWVMNNCFSLQDVSSRKDALNNHLDFGESRSESEIVHRSANQSAESTRRIEDTPSLPLICENTSFHIEPDTTEEDKRLNAEVAYKESSVMDLEGSKDVIDHSQSGMETMTMKQSNGDVEDQINKQKMMNEDLHTQLMETYPEQRKTSQKISHPTNDLENNNRTCSEGLGETSIDLKRKTGEGVPDDDGNHWEKQLRNDWEITAASEKLAECQETIQNLGKQLKAMASPRDAALFDNVISTPAETVVSSISTPQGNVSRRFSLLDKMLAEDNNQTDASPKIGDDDDDIQNGNIDSAISENALLESSNKFTDPRDTNGKATVSMAIVPRRKNGGTSLLKKLFWRKKKGNSKKIPFSQPA